MWKSRPSRAPGRAPASNLGLPALATLALAACAPPDPSAEILASYRGGTVTRGEYDSWQLAKGIEDEPDQRLQRYQAIAVAEVLEDAAVARGLDAGAAVHAAVLRLEAQLLEPELRRHVAEGIEIDAAAVESRFAERRHLFGAPEARRLENLFKKLPPDPRAAAAARARMAEIRQELAGGADFAALAESESDSQSRWRGGLTGWVRSGDLDPRLEAAVFELEPGELSPVIEATGGLHLFRCREVREARRPDDDQIRRRIEGNLRRERVEERLETLTAELREGVRYHLDGAQLVSAADDLRVVEFAGGGLSLGELEALLELQRVRQAPADMPAERFRGLAEFFATRARMVDHARGLGLAEAPEIAARLRWGRNAILALEEVQARIRERFPPVTEDEIRARFDADPGSWIEEEQFLLQVLSIDVDPSTIRERYAFAEELAADLAADRVDFDAAARAHSDHPSAADGGRIDWRHREQAAALGPLVARVAMRLAPGETSEMVQQKLGLGDESQLWIVRMLDVRPARPRTFEEARGDVENAIGQERIRQLRREMEKELLEQIDLRPAEEPS
jgi:parvulin-like peptidyl-prolyl isomerase